MRVSRLAPGFFAVVILLLANPVSARSVWTIPGIVNAGGLNNTRFVSDVTVTNPGATATQVTISFIPSPTSNARSVTLNTGETLVYRNVVESLFGTSGAGALSISSDQPLLLRARTYNTASSGTYGVALPVYEADRLMTSGEVADSLWVSQDASGSSGYRTNIAVVFPDETGGAAVVTVYDADGNERGQKDYALDTPGLQQFAVGSFAGAVSVGRAEVAVTRGHAGGYAVVVDNVTGDSSLFAFEDRPAGFQDVLVNGVARASGRNGAFFRTDGRFYNPTDTDATVTVAFHASGNANPAPATASFTLPAGKIRDVVDVLDTLLALPVGSAGALRFQSNWPVAILCRTSNVDPSGVRQGTFGSQQKPVPVLSFLTSADAGAAITGMRQDADFRTNVGFAAGQDGALYTLTLTTATGATVASTSGSLGAWGWAQPNVQDLFPGTSIPANATLKVKVTQGSGDVYDSSIDNLSGDSVVTPIATLPATIPSSATIGPQGGSIRSSDGRLTLRVPAGALSQPVAFSFQSTTNDAPQGTGPGYQLLPFGVAFARRVLLTLAFGREETDGSSAEALTLATTSGSGWYAVGGGSVDPGRHTLTVRITSTSPSLAASAAARTAFAPGETFWAIVTAWRIDPTGKRAILIQQHKTFAVHYVGPSSSARPDEIYTLSSEPSKVNVSWLVNGVISGSASNGFIYKDTENLQGLYIAPDCPPGQGWVTISATIENSSFGPSLDYSILGTAQLHILPRKWKVRVDPDFTIICAPHAEISHHVRFIEPEVPLTLDDTLLSDKASFVFSPEGDSLTACPCGYGTASLVGQPTLYALGITAQCLWDESKDEMRVVGTARYDGIQGLKRRCTYTGGGYGDDNVDFNDSGFYFSFDGHFSPGVPRSIPAYVDVLPEGGLLVATFELTPVCP